MAFQGYVATGFTFAFDQISCVAAVVSTAPAARSHIEPDRARCHPRSERRELDSWDRAVGASVAALARGRFLSAALTRQYGSLMVRLMRCGAEYSNHILDLDRIAL